MAPTSANLFIGSLVEDFLNLEDSKSDLWLRFTDNLFLLWPHDHDSLSLFIEHLNTRCPIPFTRTISPPIFLDVDKRGVYTSVHIKLLTTSNISSSPASIPHPSIALILFPMLSVVGTSAVTLVTFPTSLPISALPLPLVVSFSLFSSARFFAPLHSPHLELTPCAP